MRCNFVDTRFGAQCSVNTKSGRKFCKRHQEKIPAVQCMAVNELFGYRCRAKTRNESGYCATHAKNKVGSARHSRRCKEPGCDGVLDNGYAYCGAHRKFRWGQGKERAGKKPIRCKTKGCSEIALEGYFHCGSHRSLKISSMADYAEFKSQSPGDIKAREERRARELGQLVELTEIDPWAIHESKFEII